MFIARCFDMAGRQLADSEACETLDQVCADAKLDEMCVSFDVYDQESNKLIARFEYQYNDETEEETWLERRDS